MSPNTFCLTGRTRPRLGPRFALGGGGPGAPGRGRAGEIGELLRREGLYSSLLTEWRCARDAGAGGDAAAAARPINAEPAGGRERSLVPARGARWRAIATVARNSPGLATSHKCFVGRRLCAQVSAAATEPRDYGLGSTEPGERGVLGLIAAISVDWSSALTMSRRSGAGNGPRRTQFGRSKVISTSPVPAPLTRAVPRQ